MFNDSISLPQCQLVTLEDAAGYIMKLPMAEQDLAYRRQSLDRRCRWPRQEYP